MARKHVNLEVQFSRAELKAEEAERRRIAKLKVFGGNLDGRRHVILRCRSLTEFCRATGIHRHYAAETRNQFEIEFAREDVVLALPYEIFNSGKRDDPLHWTPIPRKDR